MTNRLLQLRTEQVELLKQELEAAIGRIRHYRAKYPAINECDFGRFLDGSMNQGLEDSGGFTRSDFRMWSLGSVSGEDAYVYENIDTNRWSVMDDNDDIGIDTYGLARSDSHHPTYHNSGYWIGKVNVETLADHSSFSIDTIVLLTEALKRHFATEDDFRNDVCQVISRFVHSAEPKLVLS